MSQTIALTEHCHFVTFDRCFGPIVSGRQDPAHCTMIRRLEKEQELEIVTAASGTQDLVECTMI